MSDTTRDLPESEQVKAPKQITDRIKRGRARMKEGAAARNECLRFWRNDQYVYVNSENYLVKQSTVTSTDGRGKPAHRVRTRRNLIIDVVAHEVSASTQRIPSYEINASSTDPDRIAAASLSERVALWGYDQWRLRRAAVKAVTYAVVADEGFAWPFFDNSIGPFIQDGNGGYVGQGDIRIRTFGPNEVYWEPGIDFEESKWHAVEQARPLEDVYAMDGYNGGKLKPDAATSDIQNDKYTQQTQLVMVTEYLERPCVTNPQGVWLVLANDRVIASPRPYPCVDGDGKAVDEPVLHKLSYFTDPDADRDMGLVRHLLDAQRTYNDCTNKQLEWKNLALNKQVFALPGVLKQPLDDRPGAVFTVMDLNGIKERDPGAIPPDLTRLREEAKEDILRIAAQNDVPDQMEAGKAIAVFTERDANRRQEFLANLSEWHSRLMRHCLYLVQRYYTEDRLLRIRGPFGPETHAFRGADLKSEVDVRVLPASIEPLTKDGVLNMIETLAQYFPGQFTFEKAQQALDGGSLTVLSQTYTLQVQKQQREIQQMIALAGTLSPLANAAAYQKADIPIPQPWDDDDVHLDTLHQFMESEQFDDLPQEVQFVIGQHEQAHQQQKNAKAAQAAQAQLAAAQSQGMAQAAKPQTPPAAPPSPAGQAA